MEEIVPRDWEGWVAKEGGAWGEVIVCPAGGHVVKQKERGQKQW